MIADIPIDTGGLSTVTTAAKATDIALGVIGIESPPALEAIADPISFILGSFFGGDSDRNISLGAINVPAILTEAGINIPATGGGSFDSYRDAAAPLAAQIQGLGEALETVKRKFVNLGLPEEATALNVRYDARFNPNPPGHPEAVIQNQALANIVAQGLYAAQKYDSDRKNFLIENPTASNILNLFVKENPSNQQGITNNFFDLFKDNSKQTAQNNLRSLTGRSDSYINQLIIANSPQPVKAVDPVEPKAVLPPEPKAVLPPEPKRPQLPYTRGAPHNINVTVPPIKVVVQQQQSTLGVSNFPQNPTQPANPQTSANSWQTLKHKSSVAVNAIGTVGKVAQFPFFIRDTFFNTIDDLQTVFFGESGSIEDFNFDFPVSDPPAQRFQQQSDIFSLLAAQKKVKDQSFGVEELESENSMFAQLSPTAKTLLPILLGLITTIIIIKKRGVKT